MKKALSSKTVETLKPTPRRYEVRDTAWQPPRFFKRERERNSVSII